MTCLDCKARLQMARDALFKARVSESLGHAAKGVAEMVGIKPKTGLAEMEEKAKEQPLPLGKTKAKTKNPGNAG